VTPITRRKAWLVGGSIPVKALKNLKVLMLNHISIGVSSITAAKAFYDAALNPLGYRCLSEDAASLGYGSERVVLWVLKSDKPVPGYRIEAYCSKAP